MPDSQQPAKATIASSQGGIIKLPCGTPAPLAVNGGGYVGCSLARGHAGSHTITILWGAADVVIK